MPRIDYYVKSLERFGASGVVLASGAHVTLLFPTGDRYASQATPHEELVALVEEIASPSLLPSLRRGAPGALRVECAGRRYRVSVESEADRLRIMILPAPVEETVEPARAAVPLARMVSEKPRPPETPRVAVEATPRTYDHVVDRMLVRMHALGASDLHLSSGAPPRIRLHGAIRPLDGFVAAAPEALQKQLFEVTPEKNRREFDDRSDTDFAHMLPGVARFRVNLFQDWRGPAAVFRAIPFRILSPEELGLPPRVLDLCDLTRGLVVVTGPTGSGKSTTLASLIDHINETRDDHIITIEDPIEFLHESKRCLVHQREVREHTRSFKDALRAALREDPDIVLVGEMRDLETVAVAIETAETGHLVFGTLHTNTAPSTVDRIIDQFSSDRQDQIRQMLAESLRGVIAQTLCKKIGGGRVAAYEVLVGSSAVSNLIRERKTFQLLSLMQTGRALGMVTLNDSLLELVKNRLVEPSEALRKSVNKAELKNALVREGLAQGVE